MAKAAQEKTGGPAWRRRKAFREPEILEAARALVEERGLRGTSMADIAEKAGISEATVYKYFPNRRDLMARVVSDWMTPNLERMARDTARIEGTAERIKLLILINFRDMAENPGMHELIYRELHWEDYYGSAVHGLNQRYARLVDSILTDGQRIGDVRPDVVIEYVRDMFFGAIQHVGERTLLNKRPLNIEAAVEAIARQLFAGIGIGGAASAGALSEVTRRLESVAATLASVAEKR